MNITRENLGELELCIKIEVAEADYAERVTKQLKDYQRKATVPGFRKGMAPMGLIQRMYKSAVVADEVQNLLGESLYKYLDDEKLNIIGSPLSNEEKTGAVDFTANKDFTFYFDAAVSPEINIAWDQVDVKMTQIKVAAKDVDAQINQIAQQYGKFETPEVVGDGDYVYGKVVELDKKGEVKEGGVSSFISFDLKTVKDDEIRAQFVGKKAEDKVVFGAAKAFSAADIEKNFRLEAAVAKKFKSDVEFTISGCSHITPAELNEELFEKVLPGEGIKEADKFRKAISKQIEKANNEQCEILFVNQVRKALLDKFDAQLPEAFLKRWILSRSDKDVTAESIEAEWAEKYLPALKWELIDAEMNKQGSIEPTHNEVVDFIKDILRKNDQPKEGEDEKAKEERIEQAAQTIANDKNSASQIVDRLYVQKTAAFLKKQIKPEVEKITAKEFSERAKAE